MGFNIGIGARVGNRRYGRSVADENERISDINDDISENHEEKEEEEEEEEEASLPEVRRQRHQELINKLLQ